MEEARPIFITTEHGGLNVNQIAEYHTSLDGTKLVLTTRTPTSTRYYELEGEKADKALEVLKSWST